MVAGVTRKHLDKIHDDVEFYEHQIDGVRRVAKLTSVILADEMGLGKSLQAATAAAIDFQRGWAKHILIICPSFLQWNWADELEAHTNYSFVVYQGTPKERKVLRDNFDSDILIVGYRQIANDREFLRAMPWDIAIVDEAHGIKSRTSQQTKAVHSMPIPRWFLLTGSPVLNRPDELWSLLHRCDPVKFRSYWTFVNRYCNTPDAPILMADGTFKPLGEMEAGDKVMGWHTPDVSTARRGAQRVNTGAVNQRRMMIPAEVEAVAMREAEVYEFTLDDGTTVKCTPDHKWLAGNHAKGYEWVTAMPVDRGPHVGSQRVLSRVVDLPNSLTPEQQRAADWLAGLCDGEASWPFIAQHKNANPEIWERIGEVLDILGFEYTTTDLGYTVLGGRQSIVNILAWSNPAKRSMMMHKLYGQLNRCKVRVVSYRSIGVQKVVSMQTTTGNYVAWGLASKNCVFGGFKNKQIIGTKNKPELREILAQYMIRRLKKDCLDLPEKQSIPVPVEMHPDQKKTYDQIESDLQLIIPGEPDPMEIENILTKMLRLKQVAATPFTVGLEDKSHKLDKAVEMCVEFCLGENPERVVMWTQFRGVQEAMRLRLEEAGIPCYQLHGDVKQAERIPITKVWAVEKPGVLIGMLQMSTGMNLTAARRVITIDRLWVPKLMEQAEDRCHRIGADKTQPVQVFNLISRGTVEERIEKILSKKRHLFKALIEDVDTWKATLLKELHEEMSAA